MTPEDVLVESIQAAARYGDSPALRVEQCEKLIKSIHRQAVALGLYAAVPFIQGEA